MPHLKFHGLVVKQYHGIDKDTVVVAGAGDVIHVSEEKAKRLLKDFPTEFELHHSGHDLPKDTEELTPDDKPWEPEESPFLPETKEAVPSKNKMISKSKRKGKK